MVKTKLATNPTLEGYTERQRMAEILRILEKEYPDAKCSLNFKTPFQLLIATILSAQCTDERVNKVTPELFKQFPGPREMARAEISKIEKLVQSTGFFRSKAKSIHEVSKTVLEEYQGEVPRDRALLVKMRGVGRKTANVTLGVSFGIPALVVDTHVGRISRRLGFTRATDPVKVEFELMEIVPEKNWTHYGHLLIQHGRKICTARKAMCEICPISELCPKIGVKAS